ncbi:helix-turn-helix domain-containing protein [Saccharopolyspora aridisoli]|uniref:Helix-turn-helix domain-containing protein n=1 Tax=Saccharopolyspora aridisoli TaxID=2530385 RepID=A0A4R4UQ74_9PSEU|nr:helix-turn-helix domain-containing protein [Saccharopolyspora aridisoli]TDC94030.1 helix-turn-helix domain-containing protein [Saccharopolyspora aridisoli]
MSEESFGQALRRHRRAAGLSQAQLAQELHLDQGNLSRYENDRQRPEPATVRALDALLCAGGELRALANATTPQPATRGIPAAGAIHPSDETDAMELARRVAASDISTETLAQLEMAFDDLATAYPASSPHDLLPRLREHLGYISQLIDAPRKTLAAHRHLLVLGGWFSLLAATVHIDLNQHAPATARLRTAAGLATHAEQDEIRAWCYETEAWRTLTGGDYRRAAELSQHAQSIAPSGSSAEIQATAQEGRAWARLGEADATYRTVERVHSLSAHLPKPVPAEHHYRYDPGKAAAYTATTLAWLGDPEGEQHARQVIERFRPTNDSQPWPRRYATAHVDLALCTARNGRLDEAADAAHTAIESGQVAPSNWWRVREVVNHVTAGKLPTAGELQDSYRTMTSR